MDENKDILKYSIFTFEEFVNDEYFISTSTTPTEQSQLFWKTFVDNQPDNHEEFKLAVSFLELSNSQYEFLSPTESTQLWAKISATNNSSKRNKKNYYLLAMSIAASVAIFFLLPFDNLFEGKTIPNDLVNYAHNLPTLPYSEETQLIISTEKVISMDEKESTVNYESSSIKTQKEEISKSDISEYNQIITPNGKRSILTLHDGSKVWINAGSRVVYPKEFTSKSREIYVEGEVFIDVTKDEKRPFRVHTSKMNIRVLGTTFNVSAYSDEIEHSLVLVSGSVQVDINTKAKTILKPNQLFTSAGENGSVQNIDVSPYISWIDGIYKFQGASLSKVFQKLSKYYGKEITCSSFIKEIRCSGSLDLKDDLNMVLEDLSFMVGFDIKQENGKYIIVESSK